MFQLEHLQQIVKKRKRVGRGGSRGGTSGRGHKGQKARSGGGVRIGFEGGQMPLIRRLPKRGFKNVLFRSPQEIVSLKTIADAFEDGATISKEALIEKGLIHAKKGMGGAKLVRVKVLGNDEIAKKLIIEVDAFSKSAVQRIQERGGEARLIEEI